MLRELTHNVIFKRKILTQEVLSPLPRVVVADCYPDGMYKLYSEEDVANQKKVRSAAKKEEEPKKRTRRSDTPEIIRGVIAAHSSLVMTVGDIDDLVDQVRVAAKTDVPDGGLSIVATVKACIRTIQKGSLRF